MVSVSVVIVGGGPVGLVLACLLAQKGISCEVLEKRTTRSPHSRGIGLHPPALAVLEQVGVAKEILAHGVQITGGQAFYEKEALGRLSFSSVGGQYPFALSIPQNETERILEERLRALPKATLRKGVTVTSLAELSGRYAIGCDGKDSVVRQAAGIGQRGAPYPDRYLMGDFADDTEFGSDAALFLTRQGIVESFPLPGGLRRWVVRQEVGEAPATAEQLAQWVFQRLGRTLPVETCRWVSGFGVQHFVATQLVEGSVALAGDAAHVISPIGGQGITLGFLGAAALVEAIASGDLDAYARSQKRLATVVGRRAALNTALGRPCRLGAGGVLLIRALLTSPPLTRRLARQFTMRDLS